MKSQHYYPNGIRTHYQPGLDEQGALMLLERYAQEWHISQESEVAYMLKLDHDEPPISGVLDVGCGLNSWANEHYLANAHETSSCYLVARELRICRQKYGPLVEEITREDRHGSGSKAFHLARAIKDMYSLGETFERMRPWVRGALSALADYQWGSSQFSMSVEVCRAAVCAKFGLESAKRWYDRVEWAKSEMRKAFNQAMAKCSRQQEDFMIIPTYQGDLKIFAPSGVQSNPRILQAARASGASICIVRSQLDFGEVGTIIQADLSKELDLSVVVKTLRQHELMRIGTLDAGKVDRCGGHGSIDTCPQWYGHLGGDGVRCIAIYSGSLSRPLARKTVLETGYIHDLFKSSIQENPASLVAQ